MTDSPFASRFEETQVREQAEALRYDASLRAIETRPWDREANELDIYGKSMTREQIAATRFGAQYLEILERDRKGRMGFWEAALPQTLGGSRAGTEYMPILNTLNTAQTVFMALDTIPDVLKRLQNQGEVSDEERVQLAAYFAAQERLSRGGWLATAGTIVPSIVSFGGESLLHAKFAAKLGALATGGNPLVAAAAGAAGFMLGGVGAAKNMTLRRGAQVTVNNNMRRVMADKAAKAVSGGAANLKAKTVASRIASETATHFVDLIEAGARTADKVPVILRQLHDVGGAAAVRHAMQMPAEFAVRQAMDPNMASRLARSAARGLQSHAWRALTYNNIADEIVDITLKDQLLQSLGFAFVQAPIRGIGQTITASSAKAGLMAMFGEGHDVQAMNMQIQGILEDRPELYRNAMWLSLASGMMERVANFVGKGISESIPASLFGWSQVVKGKQPFRQMMATRLADSTSHWTLGNFLNKSLGLAAGTAEEARVQAASLGTRVAAGGGITKFSDIFRSGAWSATRKALGGDKAVPVVGYLIAKRAVESGITVDKAAQVLKDSLYDGVVAEMIEERVAAFLRGLFGTDGRVVEESWIPSIARGLTQMKDEAEWDQLKAEALAFALPLVARSAMAQSQSRLGAGVLNRAAQLGESLANTLDVAQGNIVSEIEGGLRVSGRLDKPFQTPFDKVSTVPESGSVYHSQALHTSAVQVMELAKEAGPRMDFARRGFGAKAADYMLRVMQTAITWDFSFLRNDPIAYRAASIAPMARQGLLVAEQSRITHVRDALRRHNIKAADMTAQGVAEASASLSAKEREHIDAMVTRDIEAVLRDALRRQGAVYSTKEERVTSARQELNGMGEGYAAAQGEDGGWVYTVDGQLYSEDELEGKFFAALDKMVTDKKFRLDLSEVQPRALLDLHDSLTDPFDTLVARWAARSGLPGEADFSQSWDPRLSNITTEFVGSELTALTPDIAALALYKPGNEWTTELENAFHSIGVSLFSLSSYEMRDEAQRQAFRTKVVEYAKVLSTKTFQWNPITEKGNPEAVVGYIKTRADGMFEVKGSMGDPLPQGYASANAAAMALMGGDAGLVATLNVPAAFKTLLLDRVTLDVSHFFSTPFAGYLPADAVNPNVNPMDKSGAGEGEASEWQLKIQAYKETRAALEGKVNGHAPQALADVEAAARDSGLDLEVVAQYNVIAEYLVRRNEALRQIGAKVSHNDGLSKVSVNLSALSDNTGTVYIGTSSRPDSAAGGVVMDIMESWIKHPKSRDLVLTDTNGLNAFVRPFVEAVHRAALTEAQLHDTAGATDKASKWRSLAMMMDPNATGKAAVEVLSHLSLAMIANRVEKGSEIYGLLTSGAEGAKFDVRMRTLPSFQAFFARMAQTIAVARDAASIFDQGSLNDAMTFWDSPKSQVAVQSVLDRWASAERRALQVSEVPNLLVRPTDPVEVRRLEAERQAQLVAARKFAPQETEDVTASVTFGDPMVDPSQVYNFYRGLAMNPDLGLSANFKAALQGLNLDTQDDRTTFVRRVHETLQQQFPGEFPVAELEHFINRMVQEQRSMLNGGRVVTDDIPDNVVWDPDLPGSYDRDPGEEIEGTLRLTNALLAPFAQPEGLTTDPAGSQVGMVAYLQDALTAYRDHILPKEQGDPRLQEIATALMPTRLRPDFKPHPLFESEANLVQFFSDVYNAGVALEKTEAGAHRGQTLRYFSTILRSMPRADAWRVLSAMASMTSRGGIVLDAKKGLDRPTPADRGASVLIVANTVVDALSQRGAAVRSVLGDQVKWMTPKNWTSKDSPRQHPDYKDALAWSQEDTLESRIKLARRGLNLSARLVQTLLDDTNNAFSALLREDRLAAALANEMTGKELYSRLFSEVSTKTGDSYPGSVPKQIISLFQHVSNYLETHTADEARKFAQLAVGRLEHMPVDGSSRSAKFLAKFQAQLFRAQSPMARILSMRPSQANSDASYTVADSVTNDKAARKSRVGSIPRVVSAFMDTEAMQAAVAKLADTMSGGDPVVAQRMVERFRRFGWFPGDQVSVVSDVLGHHYKGLSQYKSMNEVAVAEHFAEVSGRDGFHYFWLQTSDKNARLAVAVPQAYFEVLGKGDATYAEKHALVPFGTDKMDAKRLGVLAAMTSAMVPAVGGGRVGLIVGRDGSAPSERDHGTTAIAGGIASLIGENRGAKVHASSVALDDVFTFVKGYSVVDHPGMKPHSPYEADLLGLARKIAEATGNSVELAEGDAFKESPLINTQVEVDGQWMPLRQALLAPGFDTEAETVLKFRDGSTRTAPVSAVLPGLVITEAEFQGQPVTVLSYGGNIEFNEAANVDTTSVAKPLAVPRNGITDWLTAPLRHPTEGVVAGDNLLQTAATIAGEASIIMNNQVENLLTTEPGREVLARAVEGRKPDLAQRIRDGVVHVNNSIDPAYASAIGTAILGQMDEIGPILDGVRSPVVSDGTIAAPWAPGDDRHRIKITGTKDPMVRAPEVMSVEDSMFATGEAKAPRAAAHRSNVRSPWTRYRMTTKVKGDVRAAQDRLAHDILRVIHSSPRKGYSEAYRAVASQFSDWDGMPLTRVVGFHDLLLPGALETLRGMPEVPRDHDTLIQLFDYTAFGVDGDTVSLDGTLFADLRTPSGNPNATMFSRLAAPVDTVKAGEKDTEWRIETLTRADLEALAPVAGLFEDADALSGDINQLFEDAEANPSLYGDIKKLLTSDAVKDLGYRLLEVDDDAQSWTFAHQVQADRVASSAARFVADAVARLIKGDDADGDTMTEFMLPSEFLGMPWHSETKEDLLRGLRANNPQGQMVFEMNTGLRRQLGHDTMMSLWQAWRSQPLERDARYAVGDNEAYDLVYTPWTMPTQPAKVLEGTNPRKAASLDSRDPKASAQALHDNRDSAAARGLSVSVSQAFKVMMDAGGVVEAYRDNDGALIPVLRNAEGKAYTHNGVPLFTAGLEGDLSDAAVATSLRIANQLAFDYTNMFFDAVKNQTPAKLGMMSDLVPLFYNLMLRETWTVENQEAKGAAMQAAFVDWVKGIWEGYDKLRTEVPRARFANYVEKLADKGNPRVADEIKFFTKPRTEESRAHHALRVGHETAKTVDATEKARRSIGVGVPPALRKHAVALDSFTQTSSRLFGEALMPALNLPEDTYARPRHEINMVRMRMPQVFVARTYLNSPQAATALAFTQWAQDSEVFGKKESKQNRILGAIEAVLSSFATADVVTMGPDGLNYFLASVAMRGDTLGLRGAEGSRLAEHSNDVRDGLLALMTSPRWSRPLRDIGNDAVKESVESVFGKEGAKAVLALTGADVVNLLTLYVAATETVLGEASHFSLGWALPDSVHADMSRARALYLKNMDSTIIERFYGQPEKEKEDTRFQSFNGSRIPVLMGTGAFWDANNTVVQSFQDIVKPKHFVTTEVPQSSPDASLAAVMPDGRATPYLDPVALRNAEVNLVALGEAVKGLMAAGLEFEAAVNQALEGLGVTEDLRITATTQVAILAQSFEFPSMTGGKGKGMVQMVRGEWYYSDFQHNTEAITAERAQELYKASLQYDIGQRPAKATARNIGEPPPAGPSGVITSGSGTPILAALDPGTKSKVALQYKGESYDSAAAALEAHPGELTEILTQKFRQYHALRRGVAEHGGADWLASQDYRGPLDAQELRKALVTAYSDAQSQSLRAPIEVWYTDGQAAELSNLAERPFTDKAGRRYVSVEHAYQSWKSGKFDAETYGKYTQGGVKIAGDKGTRTDGNWNIDLIKRMMRLSFEQNPAALKALLATGDQAFSHTKGDKIWSAEFPRLLAEVRAELQPSFRIVSMPFGQDPGEGVIDGHRYKGRHVLNTMPGDRGGLGNPYVANDTQQGRARYDKAKADAMVAKARANPETVLSPEAQATVFTREQATEMFGLALRHRAATEPAFATALQNIRGRDIGYYKPDAESIHLHAVDAWLRDNPAATGFSVTPRDGVPQAEKQKAPYKAARATKYIGFGERSTGSYRTELAKQGMPTNAEDYGPQDVVFVSVNGQPAAQDLAETVRLATKALEAGAVLLTDSEAYLAASRYNEGERKLAAALLAEGYARTTETDNPNVARWRKAEQETPAPADINDVVRKYVTFRGDPEADRQEALDLALQERQDALEAGEGVADLDADIAVLRGAAPAMPETFTRGDARIYRDPVSGWMRQVGAEAEVISEVQARDLYDRVESPAPPATPLDQVFVDTAGRTGRLSDDQYKALKIAEDLPSSDAPRTLLIQGAAGTGKTTLVRELLRRWRYKYGEGGVLMASPTHRANWVTRLMSGYRRSFLGSETDIYANPMTLEKLMGAKPGIRGKMTFPFVAKALESHKVKAPIKQMGSRNMVIIDEVSMMDGEELSLLQQWQQRLGFTMIFLGDRDQLPPVGMKSSPVFEKGLRTTTLDQVMRQRGENPLLDWLTAFRRGEHSKPETKFNPTTAEGIIEVGTPKLAADLAARLMTPEVVAANMNHVRVLAARNATVRLWNRAIHQQLHPDATTPIVAGEPLVAYRTIRDEEGTPIIENGTDYRTVQVGDLRQHGTSYGPLMGYNVTLMDDNSSEFNAVLVAEGSQQDYIDIVLRLQEQVSREWDRWQAQGSRGFPQEAINATKAMENFTSLYGIMADVLHTGKTANAEERAGGILLRRMFDLGYATTVHKAQGGTVNIGIVDYDDISSFPSSSPEERNRMIYTAFSRAAKTSVVVSRGSFTSTDGLGTLHRVASRPESYTPVPVEMKAEDASQYGRGVVPMPQSDIGTTASLILQNAEEIDVMAHSREWASSLEARTKTPDSFTLMTQGFLVPTVTEGKRRDLENHLVAAGIPRESLELRKGRADERAPIFSVSAPGHSSDHETRNEAEQVAAGIPGAQVTEGSGEVTYVAFKSRKEAPLNFDTERAARRAAKAVREMAPRADTNLRYNPPKTLKLGYQAVAEIVEAHKKEHGIVYDPRDAWRRGEAFYSDIGAYTHGAGSVVDQAAGVLIRQAQLLKAEDPRWWDQTKDQLIVSGYTATPGEKAHRPRRGISPMRFVIRPSSGNIIWGADSDVWSGSTHLRRDAEIVSVTTNQDIHGAKAAAVYEQEAREDAAKWGPRSGFPSYETWLASEESREYRDTTVADKVDPKAPRVGSLHRLTSSVAAAIKGRGRSAESYNEFGIRLVPGEFFLEGEIPARLTQLNSILKNAFTMKYGSLETIPQSKGLGTTASLDFSKADTAGTIAEFAGELRQIHQGDWVSQVQAAPRDLRPQGPVDLDARMQDGTWNRALDAAEKAALAFDLPMASELASASREVALGLGDAPNPRSPLAYLLALAAVSQDNGAEALARLALGAPQETQGIVSRYVYDAMDRASRVNDTSIGEELQKWIAGEPGDFAGAYKRALAYLQQPLPGVEVPQGIGDFVPGMDPDIYSPTPEEKQKLDRSYTKIQQDVDRQTRRTTLADTDQRSVFDVLATDPEALHENRVDTGYVPPEAMRFINTAESRRASEELSVSRMQGLDRQTATFFNKSGQVVLALLARRLGPDVTDLQMATALAEEMLELAKNPRAFAESDFLRDTAEALLNTASAKADVPQEYVPGTKVPMGGRFKAYNVYHRSAMQSAGGVEGATWYESRKELVVTGALMSAADKLLALYGDGTLKADTETIGEPSSDTIPVSPFDDLDAYDPDADFVGAEPQSPLLEVTTTDNWDGPSGHMVSHSEWLSSLLSRNFHGADLVAIMTNHEQEAAFATAQSETTNMQRYIGANRGTIRHYRKDTAYDSAKAQGTGLDSMEFTEAQQIDVDWHLKAALAAAQSEDDARMPTGVEVRFTDAYHDNKGWSKNYFVLPTDEASAQGAQHADQTRTPFDINNALQRVKAIVPAGVYAKVQEVIAQTFDEAKARLASVRVTRDERASDRFNRLMLTLLEDRGLASVYHEGAPRGPDGLLPAGVGLDAVLTVPAEISESVFNLSEARDILVNKFGRDPERLSLASLAAWGRRIKSEADARVDASTPWLTTEDGRRVTGPRGLMPFNTGRGMHRKFHRPKSREIPLYVDKVEEVLHSLRNTVEFSAFRDSETHEERERLATESTPRMKALLADLYGVHPSSINTFLEKGKAHVAPADAYGIGLLISDLTTTLARLNREYQHDELLYRDLGHAIALRHLDRVVDEVVDLNPREVVRRAAENLRNSLKEPSREVDTLSMHQMWKQHHMLPDGKLNLVDTLATWGRSVQNAVRWREAALALFSASDETGIPKMIAAPNLAIDASKDIFPDAVWSALAQAWAPYFKMEYDAGLTGRENMARVAAEARGQSSASRNRIAKGAADTFVEVAADGMQAISHIYALRDTDPDQSALLSTFSGGSAGGYARQLLYALGMTDPRARLKAIQDVVSFSRTMNMAWSLFFPWATGVESAIAAGGLTRVLGNIAPQSFRRLEASRAGQFVLSIPILGPLLGDHLSGQSQYARDLTQRLRSVDPEFLEIQEFAVSAGLMGTTGKGALYESGSIDTEWEQQVVSRARAVGGDSLVKKVNAMKRLAFEAIPELSFETIMTATKTATLMNTLTALKQAAESQGRVFNAKREIKRWTPYINAEIGSIDLAMYPWLTPGGNQILQSMFLSFQWTMGALEAGGAGTLLQKFTGHEFAPEVRKFVMMRWARMATFILVGLPAMAQAMFKAAGMAAGVDDEEGKWLMWNNEIGRRASADVTPFLKAMAKIPGVKSMRDSSWRGVRALGRMIPAHYREETTGHRRYYMRWGKQGYELGTLFVEGNPQKYIIGKMSGPAQAVLEWGFARNLAMDWEKPYRDPASGEPLNHFQRLFTGDQGFSNGAIANLITRSFLPFSLANQVTSPVSSEAGFLTALAPVSKGMSKAAAMDRMNARLRLWANRGPQTGMRFTPPLWRTVGDLITMADVNGHNGLDLAQKAVGQVAETYYRDIYENIPGNPSGKVDLVKAGRAYDALTRLHRGLDSMSRSLKNRDQGRNRVHSSALWGLRREAIEQARHTGTRRLKWDPRDVRQAARGGDVSGILEGDELPDSILGYEIVDNTAADNAYFQKHPEAGGFYDRSPDDRDTGVAEPRGDVSFLASDNLPPAILGYTVVKPEDLSDDDLEYFRQRPGAAGFFEKEDNHGRSHQDQPRSPGGRPIGPGGGVERGPEAVDGGQQLRPDVGAHGGPTGGLEGHGV